MRDLKSFFPLVYFQCFLYFCNKDHILINKNMCVIWNYGNFANSTATVLLIFFTWFWIVYFNTFSFKISSLFEYCTIVRGLIISWQFFIITLHMIIKASLLEYIYIFFFFKSGGEEKECFYDKWSLKEINFYCSY